LPLRLADEAVEDEPIEQKYYRQEYRELDGVEEHIWLCFADAKVGIILIRKTKWRKAFHRFAPFLIPHSAFRITYAPS
jgi:hypothetical protein